VVREVHFGEGAYDETEHAIQELLKESGEKNIGDNIVNVKADTVSGNNLSPETYVGSERMQFYYPLSSLSDGQQKLQLEETPPVNSFSLGGTWTVSPQFSSTGDNSTLTYHFYAKKVFLVMHPPEGEVAKVKVYLDGKLISTFSGNDLKSGVITVDQPRLYNLVNLNNYENHILKLEFLTPNTEVFAFTFG
jgi:hypothetical protein